MFKMKIIQHPILLFFTHLILSFGLAQEFQIFGAQSKLSLIEGIFRLPIQSQFITRDKLVEFDTELNGLVQLLKSWDTITCQISEIDLFAIPPPNVGEGASRINLNFKINPYDSRPYSPYSNSQMTYSLQVVLYTACMRSSVSFIFDSPDNKIQQTLEKVIFNFQEKVDNHSMNVLSLASKLNKPDVKKVNNNSYSIELPIMMPKAFPFQDYLKFFILTLQENFTFNSKFKNIDDNEFLSSIYMSKSSKLGDFELILGEFLEALFNSLDFYPDLLQ